jgi:hypothetical protein
MSFYFYIKTNKQLKYDDVLSNIVIENIEINKYGDDELIDEEGCKIYVPFKSTRGITLKYDGSEYSIGINVIAAPIDFQIAIDLARLIAQQTEEHILPEDSDPITTEQLFQVYNNDWIELMKLLGIEIFLEKIGKENNTIAIGCCYMSYNIGPNIHKSLNTNSKEHYYKSLIDRIANTQFFDTNRFILPSILIVTNQETNETRKIVVFYPSGNQFLAKADIVSFSNNGERLEFPYSLLKEIKTDKFNLIDEVQYTIDSLTDKEFEEIFNNAKLVINRQNIEVSENVKTKKWYKFW